MVENKKRRRRGLLEDLDDSSWEELYQALQQEGSYPVSALDSSPLYDQGIRVWGKTPDDLLRAEQIAGDLGHHQIKRTYDKTVAGDNKWRLDINTEEEGVQ